MTYQEAMQGMSRELDIRGNITLADSTVIPLTNAHIMAYGFDEGTNEAPLGSAASASFTLELANAQGEWFPGGDIIGARIIVGARVEIEIGVYHDGAYEYKPAGVWYVHKPSGKEGGTRFVLKGHDALYSSYDDPLNDSGITYAATTTLNDVLTGVKAAHGLTVGGTLKCNTGAIIAQRPDWGEGCSVRNALAYIAGAGGCSIQINRAGGLQFVPVVSTAAAKPIGTDSYLELENANAHFMFNRIKVMPRGAQAETPYTEAVVLTGVPESGNNTLVMTDNPLFANGASNLQSMVDALAAALNGFSFDLMTFKHRGDPTYCLGDWVQVTDRRGKVKNTPILQHTLKYGAGINATISSMVSLDMMLPSTISRNGTLSPVGFGKGVLDASVLILKSVTSDYIAANTITADEIDMESMEADIASIAQAKIDVAEIDYNKVKDLVAGTAIFREGIGGKILIDRLEVSDANIVNLTAGRLIVQGTSGALYQLSVDEQGQVITELRQIGNADVADVSLNAGEKLVHGSITADLLNVQQIFASEALIGAIKANNIETHSIGLDQLTPNLFENMIANATGQQMVIEFSNGTILDRENTETIARIRVFHLGVDITHRLPDTSIHWERISDDPAGDQAWNADPAHQNTKTVTINAADVNFRGVLRCRVDEARLFSVPGVTDDGVLTMTDYGSGDAQNFALVDGNLVYSGDTPYEIQDGILYTEMLIGAFHLDTQMSNFHTSYMNMSRRGVELYSGGFLNLISGAEFDLQAGSGDTFLRFTNKDPLVRLLVGGETKETAPVWIAPDGTIKATKLQLNNSNITDFTQYLTYDDVDNAAPGFPMTFDVFVPNAFIGIESILLTFKLDNFRAYSTGAASGGGATSSAGGGGARTSRSGGGTTSGSSGEIATYYTNTATIGTNHRHFLAPHTHSINSHSHVIDIPDHTHTVPNHTHPIAYGIYKGGKATACQVHVDGRLVGSYASLTARDITSYITKAAGKITRNTWHTVTLTPNALTRIKAQVNITGLVGRADAAIY